METLLALKSVSIEEVVGHLHAMEQHKNPMANKDEGGLLLLTEEEWMARMKIHKGYGSNTGSHRGGGGSSTTGSSSGGNKNSKGGK
jgi:hypothetical protein